MKIRTQETVQKYETWEYTFDGELPEGFFSWNGEDQYNWLLVTGCDAICVDTEYADLGTIDEIEVVV